jgi:hypothetical protein
VPRSASGSTCPQFAMRPGNIVQIELAYPALLETDTNGGYAIGAWRTPARVANTVRCREGRVLRSVCVVGASTAVLVPAELFMLPSGNAPVS